MPKAHCDLCRAGSNITVQRGKLSAHLCDQHYSDWLELKDKVLEDAFKSFIAVKKK